MATEVREERDLVSGPAVRCSHAAALLALGALLQLTQQGVLRATTAAAAPAPASTFQGMQAVPPREPGVNTVYVRDMWVAGHAVPHPELCPARGARLRLLILVTSAPEHAAARLAVRLTWGRFRTRADVTLAFVVGVAPALKTQLDAEDELYGDLIRSRSHDSYSNLTLKTLSMLEWANTYCPGAPFLLKIDDDMFLNVPALLRFLSSPLRMGATRTIWGRVKVAARPVRRTCNKHYVPPEEYPRAVYPAYATGPAYLMSVDCIAPLLAAAPHEPYLRAEDVFVTGVLADKLGLARQQESGFYNYKTHPCRARRRFSVHQVRYHEQFDFWNNLLVGSSECIHRSEGATTVSYDIQTRRSDNE